MNHASYTRALEDALCGRPVDPDVLTAAHRRSNRRAADRARKRVDSATISANRRESSESLISAPMAIVSDNARCDSVSVSAPERRASAPIIMKDGKKDGGEALALRAAPTPPVRFASGNNEAATAGAVPEIEATAPVEASKPNETTTGSSGVVGRLEWSIRRVGDRYGMNAATPGDVDRFRVELRKRGLDPEALDFEFFRDALGVAVDKATRGRKRDKWAWAAVTAADFVARRNELPEAPEPVFREANRASSQSEPETEVPEQPATRRKRFFPSSQCAGGDSGLRATARRIERSLHTLAPEDREKVVRAIGHHFKSRAA